MAPTPVTFTGESGAVYQLDCFGTNAACRVEAALDRSYDEVMAELRGPNPRVTTAREWFRASLVSPKPETLTLEQVGEAIDDCGGWTVVLVGLDSQSPVAKAIGDHLMALAALANASDPESVTH